MQLILLICKSSNFSVFYVFGTLSNWKLNVSLVSPKMCRTAAAACSTAWQSGGRSCHFPCGLLTPTSIMVPSHCFLHKIALCCFLWGWGGGRYLTDCNWKIRADEFIADFNWFVQWHIDLFHILWVLTMCQIMQIHYYILYFFFLLPPSLPSFLPLFLSSFLSVFYQSTHKMVLIAICLAYSDKCCTQEIKN